MIFSTSRGDSEWGSGPRYRLHKLIDFKDEPMCHLALKLYIEGEVDYVTALELLATAALARSAWLERERLEHFKRCTSGPIIVIPDPSFTIVPPRE